ncbi:MAG: hypothetical protein N4J56_002499 [Chroococcidiopsis sp. SAG 2025]|uniref:hypothetical protein n=1 Tax=Chroococcidiopsis sp. SAG 2025 TaxID=171389 RepID=UPI002936D921|nr:hypothetical protein [Chroococcidiopsis sp. SAG 2025]MDV2992845.1 hypothetical protein [Chroococcidiopsis sp. SAG 2025]
MTQVDRTQTNAPLAFEIREILAAREGIIEVMSELEDRIFDPAWSISTVLCEAAHRYAAHSYENEHMQTELDCIEKNINTEYDSAILALSKIVMQLKRLETSLKVHLEMEAEAKQKVN